MASNNEVSKPTLETEMGQEKDQIKSTGRSRNTQRKSKRSAKKVSKKNISNKSPSKSGPPEQQEGDTLQQLEPPKASTKSNSIMRKMSLMRKEKKVESIANGKKDCTTESTKPGSDEICLAQESSKSKAQNSSDSKIISNSAQSVLLTSKDDKGHPMIPPTQNTSNSLGESQEGSLSTKDEKKTRITKSDGTRKKIAINSAGKSIDFEYVGNQPECGSVAAVYKASMSPKSVRKFFGKIIGKKGPSTVSKIEKETEKQASKSVWKTKLEKISSKEQKKDIDDAMTHCSNTLEIEEKDNHISKSDFPTLVSQIMSGDLNSSTNDTVDGIEKVEDSSDCIDNNGKRNYSLMDNDISGKMTPIKADSDNPFHDMHSLIEENSDKIMERFQSAIKSDKVDLASTAVEIIDPNIVSKSNVSDEIQGEMSEEKIESTLANSSSTNNHDVPSQGNNIHPPRRSVLERDSSRLGKLFQKRTAEVEHTPGEQDITKPESEGGFTTSSGLDHEDQHHDEKTSPVPGFFRSHSIRATRKTKKGNVKTLDRQGEFLVKYMKVHGESEGAYKNESEPRGLIFMKNMEGFKSGSYNARSGSREDYMNLLSLFIQMGYIPAENLCESGYIEKNKLINDFKTFAKLSHKKYDSAIIIVMSHGVEDKKFVTSDEKQVELSKLYKILNTNNCSGLKGKPKIFIFQFCRPSQPKRCSVQLVNSVGEGLNISIAKPGKKVDIRKMLLNFFALSKLPEESEQSLDLGNLSQFQVKYTEDSETEVEDEDSLTEATHPTTEVDSMAPPRVLLPGPDLTPDNSDMYSIFATQAGGVAYRDPKKGSFLIQAICDVFSKHAYQDDIDGLVRKVSQHVQNKITDIQSHDAVPSRPGVVERVNSGLDKLFYFNPYPRGVMKDGSLLSDKNLLSTT